MPETGRVSTPYAPNVPPPPSSQAGRRGWVKFAVGGCGALVLLFVLIVACAVAVGSRGGNSGNSANSGSSSSSPAKQSSGETTVGIGQTATVGDASWVVTSAKPTNKLTSQFGSQSKKGNFVVVDFTFTNNGSDPKTLTTNVIKLIDSSGRNSSPDTDTLTYIPNDKNIFLDQVNPGVNKDGEVIFSVAPDASGFTLQLSNTNFLKSDKADVDLGF